MVKYILNGGTGELERIPNDASNVKRVNLWTQYGHTCHSRFLNCSLLSGIIY